jgi:hypothetical protein
LAIATGAAYFTYQNLQSDTLSGQLARSRLGVDKQPPILNLYQKEADYSKPLSQQYKSRLERFLDELYYNATGQHRSPTASTVKNPDPYNRTSYAAYYYYNKMLSQEEEK